MRFFTDHPSHTQALLPPGLTWAPVADATLTTGEQAAWPLLAPGRRLYLAESSGDPCAETASSRSVPGHPAPATDTAMRPTSSGHGGPASQRCAFMIDDAPGSQFDALAAGARTANEWPPHIVAVALTGRQFHGQRGRSWQALRGNLHFTAQYTVDLDARRVTAGMTALPAVAVVAAVHTLAPQARLRIKWVNDILHAGEKVAGVITATQAQETRISRLTIGIGINVCHRPELPVPERSIPAGTLSALQLDLGALLHTLLDTLDDGVQQLATDNGVGLVARYREYADFIGRRVVLWPDEEAADQPLAVGRVTAMNDDLALCLEGVPAPIRKGRMGY